jgi:diacylglycerol kinase family enzyme
MWRCASKQPSGQLRVLRGKNALQRELGRFEAISKHDRFFKMRVTLIHNRSKGKGQVKKNDLVAACKLAGFEVSYHSSKADNIQKILLKRTDLVVVAGGDGLVSEIARHLLDRDIPLGIVPLGNANNIARSLGVAGSLPELAESWSQGKTRTLDIGIAVGAWGSRNCRSRRRWSDCIPYRK